MFIFHVTLASTHPVHYYFHCSLQADLRDVSKRHWERVRYRFRPRDSQSLRSESWYQPANNRPNDVNHLHARMNIHTNEATRRQQLQEIQQLQQAQPIQQQQNANIRYEWAHGTGRRRAVRSRSRTGSGIQGVAMWARTQNPIPGLHNNSGGTITGPPFNSHEDHVRAASSGELSAGPASSSSSTHSPRSSPSYFSHRSSRPNANVNSSGTENSTHVITIGRTLETRL